MGAPAAHPRRDQQRKYPEAFDDAAHHQRCRRARPVAAGADPGRPDGAHRFAALEVVEQRVAEPEPATADATGGGWGRRGRRRATRIRRRRGEAAWWRIGCRRGRCRGRCRGRRAQSCDHLVPRARRRAGTGAAASDGAGGVAARSATRQPSKRRLRRRTHQRRAIHLDAAEEHVLDVREHVERDRRIAGDNNANPRASPGRAARDPTASRAPTRRPRSSRSRRRAASGSTTPRGGLAQWLPFSCSAPRARVAPAPPSHRRFRRRRRPERDRNRPRAQRAAAAWRRPARIGVRGRHADQTRLHRIAGRRRGVALHRGRSDAAGKHTPEPSPAGVARAVDVRPQPGVDESWQDRLAGPVRSSGRRRAARPGDRPR